MSRVVQLMATESGQHYILIGLDANSLSSFEMQLWLEKFGKRMIDWLSPLGQNMISFMGGDLWVHNSDKSPRANLFGEQKEVEVGVVVNTEPNKVKLLNSLGIQSDSEWEVISLVIPPTLNRPAGMYSKIPKEHFKKRNGVWRAHFLRNLKTNASSVTFTDAVKGEELSGHTAYMILRNVNNPTGDQVKLFGLEVDMDVARSQ